MAGALTKRKKSANSAWRFQYLVLLILKVGEISNATNCAIFLLMFRNNRTSSGNRRTDSIGIAEKKDL